MIISSCLALALASPTMQAAEAGPDRSGLDSLKKVLAAMGSLKETTFEVQRQEREAEGALLTTEGQTLYEVKAPDTFRIQSQSLWGDALLVIRAGKELLVDPLVLGQEAVLRDVPETPDALWQAAGTDFAVGVLPRLLSGEAALKAFGPDGQAVTAKKERGGEVIEATGTRWGKLTISVTWEPTFRLNFVERVSSRRGGFFNPVVRETVVAWGRLGKKPKEAFEARPEKGTALDDRRKKDS